MKNILIIIIFAFSTCPLLGNTYISNANGNWSSATTWLPNGVPGVLDTVIINTYTITQDIVSGASISRLVVNSGKLVTPNRLTITGTLDFFGGTTYGVDTIFVNQKADFTSTFDKNIGNVIVLGVGGSWHNGTIYFTINPTTGISNFDNTCVSTTNGLIVLQSDSFKVNPSVNLSFRSNNNACFSLGFNTTFHKTGAGDLTNIGCGWGIVAASTARIHVQNGGGVGGGGGGGDDSDDDDPDPDPSGGDIVGGDLFQNPGGDGVGLQLGSSCNTNENAGNSVPQINFEGQIVLESGAKVLLKSGINFTHHNAVTGIGKIRFDHTNVSFNGDSIDVQQIILVNKSVLKGNAKIKSKKVSSNASTIKGNLNLYNQYLFLTNSFLVGNGNTIVDSTFELKGSGVTLNRSIFVKKKSKWLAPNVSFTVNGKITIDSSAFMDINYGSSQFYYNKGKGDVIFNKGILNFQGTSTGGFLTLDQGNGFRGGPNSTCRHNLDGGGGSGSGGGGGTSGGGDVDTGGGGTSSSGCSTDPVPEIEQEGCIKLHDGNLKLSKGKMKFKSGSCVQSFGTGYMNIYSNAITTFDAGSDPDLSVTTSGNANVIMHACNQNRPLTISGSSTVSINSPCNLVTLNYNSGGTLAGNGTLNISQNMTISSGAIGGTRDININGNLIFTSGTIKNNGSINVTGKLVWSHGYYGDGVASGTLNVADSSILNLGTKNIYKNTINFNGHVKWNASPIYLFDNPIINIAANKNFNIEGAPIPFNQTVISGVSTTGQINNYGTINNNYSNGEISFLTKFRNFGQVNITNSSLGITGKTFLENGSVLYIDTTRTCTFHGDTTECKLGSYILGRGTLKTVAGGKLIFRTGSISDSTLLMNCTSPSTVVSNRDLTFTSITTNGFWQNQSSTIPYNIRCKKNLVLSGGSLRNYGNINILGKLLWSGGNIGDGVVTGIVNVSDSTILTGNDKTLLKKTLNFNNHVLWTYTNIYMDNNATINIASGINWNINGNSTTGGRNISGTAGTINNYGTILKNYTTTTQISPALNNFGSIIVKNNTLTLYGNTNLEDGSSIQIDTTTVCTFYGITSIKSGSIITGKGKIIGGSGTIYFKTGSLSDSTLVIDVVGSTINSERNLVFHSITNSGGQWTNTFHLKCKKDFSLFGGYIKNQGDVNIEGKLFWNGGNIGDGLVTGNVHVADSTILSLNPKTLSKKNLHLHGHTKWNNTGIILNDNATINTDTLKYFNIESNAWDISGTGTFNNKGILKKIKSNNLSISTIFNNTGTLSGVGVINFTSSFNNSGIVSPGLSPGKLILNKFNNNSSIVNIELEKISGVIIHDTLNITSSPATLGGILMINLAAGALPDSAQSFTIMNISSSGYGTFNERVTYGLPNDSMNFKLIYGTNTVSIKFCPMWYVDMDGDGFGDLNNPAKFCDCISQPAGFSRDYSDCNDADPLEKPNQTWYIDADSDGYGSSALIQCARPTNGFVIGELSGSGSDDCDDSDVNLHPNSLTNVVHSVQDGLWNDYTTWMCGIPTIAGDSIYIDHNIDLNTDITIDSDIFINKNGGNNGHLKVLAGKSLIIQNPSSLSRILRLYDNGSLTIQSGGMLEVKGLLDNESTILIEENGILKIKNP